MSSPNPSPNTAQPRNVNHNPRDRIDSILDSARARKVAMDDSSGSTPVNPRELLSGGNGRMEHEAETYSSADEETSIVRRGSKRDVNYQSTLRSTRSTRSQPSTSSIRRSGRTYEHNEHEDEEVIAGEHEGWWAKFISEYGSIELENKGSVARDHLALERTFLAWLRTSLAFASIGIAITQLFRLNTASASHDGNDRYRHLRQLGKPLGATFLGISIVMLFVGFHRYFESQHWIIRGKFPASRGSITLVAAITFALMITSLVVVVVVEPSSFEKR